MTTPAVSVVVPAYNEAARLGASLKRITDYFRSLSTSFEVVVVDDGSTDDTASIARAAGEPVKLVELPENRGKGAAVRAGVAESRGRSILFTDADLSTPIDQWKPIHHKLEEGYDVVVGSRGLADSRIELHQPWYREHMGKTFNWILRRTLPLELNSGHAMRLQAFRIGRGEATLRCIAHRRFRLRCGNSLPRRTLRLSRR